MKKITTLALALVALVCLFTSCTEKQTSQELVTVTVGFSGLNITSGPIGAKTSDQDATSAGVKRINLAIYDLSGNLVLDTIQNYDTDPTTFGQTVTLRIPVGSYKFVAVAHTVASTTDAAATISSATQVDFGALTKLASTYTKVQDVTISGNTTGNVTVDFGTRRNAIFSVKITDPTPDAVQSVQLIVNPTASDYTNLLANPATGCATTTWRYVNTLGRDYYSDNTLTGHNFGVPVLLTGNTQSVTITINTLGSDNSVLYSRTLTGVTLTQGHQTKAIGTFFSSSTSSSFIFDDDIIYDTISLD